MVGFYYCAADELRILHRFRRLNAWLIIKRHTMRISYLCNLRSLRTRKSGAPGAIPTRDLSLRRRALYATELREHTDEWYNVSCQLSVVSCQLSVVSCQLSVVVRCQRPFGLRLTTDNEQLTTYD